MTTSQPRAQRRSEPLCAAACCITLLALCSFTTPTLAQPSATSTTTTHYQAGTTTTFGPAASETATPAARYGPQGEAPPPAEYGGEAQSSSAAYETQAGEMPKPPAFRTGPLKITLGGFIELATIWRNRNETADVGSSFSAIPLGSSPQSAVSEFRFSARQSRISLLIQGDPYAGAHVEGYFETDFLGAAPTANSVESNSYNLRMRNIYARFITDSGFYLLAGQSWSLTTLYRQGLEPRQEDAPLTIDAQYVVGFNWLRVPQVRLVQKLNDVLSVGFSLESPQAIISTSNNVPSSVKVDGTSVSLSPYPSGTIFNNTGGSLLNPTTTYSLDVAPDMVLKAAADTAFGHYELYGLGRFFRSSVAGNDETTFGGGVGAGAIIPIVPDLLKVQASGLWGRGIGRYASGQLPDVIIKPDGSLSPVSEYDLLLGAQFTPNSDLTLYGYVGREKAGSDTYSSLITVGDVQLGPYSYGYGSPAYNNSGCYTLGAAASTCVANTSDLNEVTGGLWWKYYSSPLGNLQFGLQAAYIQRHTFGGLGGAPDGSIFVGMASFRYYPYQR